MLTSKSAVALLAAMLQVAQAPAPDGLIHITCTFPSMDLGQLTIPAIAEQVIINPATRLVWTSRGCSGSATTVPATIDQGTIFFEVRCQDNSGKTWAWQSMIDRYTGTIVEKQETASLPLSSEPRTVRSAVNQQTDPVTVLAT